MTARETAMRRIALFLLTNIAVLFLLSIVCHLFGVDTWPPPVVTVAWADC